VSVTHFEQKRRVNKGPHVLPPELLFNDLTGHVPLEAAADERQCLLVAVWDGSAEIGWASPVGRIGVKVVESRLPGSSHRWMKLGGGGASDC